MVFSTPSRERPLRLGRHIGLLTVLWTAVICLSFFLKFLYSQKEVDEEARLQADIIYDRMAHELNELVRDWTQTPDLEVAHRLQEMVQSLQGLRIFTDDRNSSQSQLTVHLVGGRPRNPANRPDSWEAAGLKALEAGAPEVVQVERRGVASSMHHYLRPLRMEQQCLPCHQASGVRVGGVMGAVDIAFSTEALWGLERGDVVRQGLGHAVIWLIGLGGLLAMMRSLRSRFRERDMGRRALRQERDFVNAVIDAPGALVLVLDRAGRIVRFNRACEQVSGYAAAEALGQEYFTLPLLPEAEREAARRACSAPEASPGDAVALEREGAWRTRDGERRQIAWSYAPLRGEDGALEYVIIKGIDITERRAMEARLRASEEKFRNLFENCNDAIFLADARSGEVLDANRAAERLLGLPRERLIGSHQSQIHPPEDAERYRAIFGVRAEGTRPLLDCEVQHTDGRRVPVEISASTITLGGRRVVQGVFRDVSERKRGEEERLRFEEKLQQAQKLESLGVLAGGIAHDFNNLLMGVLGYADLALLELAAESPARHSVQQIVTAALRAADLTRQMLAYSGKGRFVIEQLDLSRLVEEMSHLMQVSISKKAALRFDFAPSLPPIEGDATQIRQVVMNLITNASDALGERSGVITIRTGAAPVDRSYLQSTYMDDNLPEGPYAYIEVSDSGCGMDAETRARIFDPFFTTKFTGRGLGLAAVLGIVRGHKGGIKVYSEVGQGTTFKVLFPCKPEAAPAPEAAAGPEEARRGAGLVLVVDDEETVRSVSKMALEKSGFSVMTAGDGREGLSVFQSHGAAIDLVVLDMTMPHMNGEEAFREMRRLRPGARVILSSGYNEHEATHRFAGKGLAGFIQKPYRARDLVEKVAELLGGGGEG